MEIPQNGRHPDDYHEWVESELIEIDQLAKGDKEVFERLFKERIRTPLEKEPERIFKEFYEVGE